MCGSWLWHCCESCRIKIMRDKKDMQNKEVLGKEESRNGRHSHNDRESQQKKEHQKIQRNTIKKSTEWIKIKSKPESLPKGRSYTFNLNDFCGETDIIRVRVSESLFCFSYRTATFTVYNQMLIQFVCCLLGRIVRPELNEAYFWSRCLFYRRRFRAMQWNAQNTTTF